MQKKVSIGVCVFVFLLLLTKNCLALTQDEKAWFGFNAQQTLSQDKKWLSFIFTQLRTINKSHPVQSGLVEGGLGYQLTVNQSIWFGYRWTGRNPNNGFYQENRLFQQFIQQRKLTNSNRLLFRSRLEEVEHTNSSQFSVRLRERIALELMPSYFRRVYPFFYEELFFQLKTAHYTSNKLVDENRLFLGFNLYTFDKTWWEIGYINQYQMHSAEESENRMSHIISFTYNIA